MQLGCLPTEQHTLNTTRNELILKKSGDNSIVKFLLTLKYGALEARVSHTVVFTFLSIKTIYIKLFCTATVQETGYAQHN